MTRWRLIEFDFHSGHFNMAADEAILRAHMEGASPPTLRFYGWRPPAVSLGRFQSASRVVRPGIKEGLGIDVVRRPTGGKAILHHEDEVTFGVVVSEEELAARGVMESYRRLAEGILAGLELLGIEGRLVASAGSPPRRGGNPACFAVKAGCDLMVGERKLVGSAQVHRGRFLLQQNSLPLRLDWERGRQVFPGLPEEPPEATGLWAAAGRRIEHREVARALAEGLARRLGIQLEAGQLTEREMATLSELSG
jgi:lipoate-protein ligase A